uniref:Uncharacterized protein n=1 Tax=Timspurckia oligopyrenoides TaxID=708627 RepID=A0A7S1EQD2_9RHOD|mmetsp:Transcript_12609/g.22733  ORF Transcript_12609/g.22733 Transcript_12609/m.22733 type:complete len:244 (+) Transcript_12609:54-785(+)
MGIFDKLKKKKGEEVKPATVPVSAPAPAAPKVVPAAVQPPPVAKADTIANDIQAQQKKIDLLSAKEGQLLKRIENEQAQAKAFMANKDRASAARCLTRKKQYEAQLESMRNQRANLEQILLGLEQAATNKVAVSGLDSGASALHKAQQDVDVDKLDEIQMAVEEQLQKAHEISTAAGQPLNGGFMVDQFEIGDELDELEAEALQDKISAAPVPGSAAGKVPQAAPASVDVSDELSALEKQLQL